MLAILTWLLLTKLMFAFLLNPGYNICLGLIEQNLCRDSFKLSERSFSWEKVSILTSSCCEKYYNIFNFVSLDCDWKRIWKKNLVYIFNIVAGYWSSWITGALVGGRWEEKHFNEKVEVIVKPKSKVRVQILVKGLGVTLKSHYTPPTHPPML